MIIPLNPVSKAPLTDAPSILRNVADEIQAEIEKYGEGCICRVVMVVRISGQEPRVHAMGDVEHIAQSYMDLQAGAQQLLGMSSPAR